MEIQCKFYTTTWDNRIKYTCRISGAFIVKPETDILTFNGIHEKGKTNEDVEGVYFCRTTVKYFPKDLNKHFPNIKFLDIYKCGLEVISRKDLVGLENLEALYLPGNKLSFIPEDLFIDIPHIKQISFFGNTIESVSSKFFESFKNNVEILGGVVKTEDQSVDESVNKGDESFKKLEAIKNANLELFTSHKYYDICIAVSGNEFKVHKAILGPQSLVFDKLFTTQSEQVMPAFESLENYNPKSFEDFLKFFYTKEIDTESDVIMLYELANLFDVPNLKTACEDFIFQNVDGDSALQVYNLGHKHGSETLKRAGFDELKPWFPVIAEQLMNEPDLVNSLFSVKQRNDAQMTIEI